MNDIRDFQHYPLRKAQSATKGDAQGLFNTLFILQKSPNTAETSGRTILTSIEGSSATEYPVCVEAEAMSNTLVWRLAFQPQLHWDGSPKGILESLDCAMNFLVRPDNPELLSFEEKGVSICGMPVFVEGDGVGSEPVPPTAPFLDVDMEWTPVEAGIRDILHQISGIPLSSIKVSDNLYHLGLDSISAIKVSSNLRKAGINLRPQDLVKSSSISEMARRVRKEETTLPKALELVGEWEPPKDINVEELLNANGIADDQADLLPALPMQVYMLKAWQKAEGSVFFPEFSYQINTSAGLEDIREAWDKFVSETPILRTCFITTPSETVPVIQAILKHHRIPLSESHAEDFLEGHARPLVTASIAKHDENSWLMRLKIHHALYDGISLTALLRRFSQFLEGAVTVDNEGLSHWKQFTIGQATVSALNKRREFWITYLKGPCFSPRFIEPQVEVGKRFSHFDKSAISNISQIQAVATQSGVSIQSLFLAAYARVVVAQDDLLDGRSVVFGIYLANRAAANDGLPHTYPTLNLVPLKVDSPAGRSLLDIAGNIQRDLHQITSEGRSNVGLWEIARWTGIQVTSFVNFLSLPNDTNPAQDPITPLSETDFNGTGDDHVPIQHQQALRQNIIEDDMPVSSHT
jgi:aryl carrier-like protein